MMYVGEVPWHGLGRRLDSPATAAEAIEAAGLDYQVELARLVTSDGIPVPDRQAVVRSDTRSVLGVVGRNYRPAQNRDCFDFLDGLAAEGGVRYHTAGALGRGEKVWLMAKLPGSIRVRGSEDAVEKFLLLSTSHDGSSAIRVLFTPTRVVCSNTLALALNRGDGEGIAIRHQGDLMTKIRKAREVLGIAQAFFDDIAGSFDRLAGFYPKAAQLDAYFRSLIPDPEGGNPSRARNSRDELFRLFERGMGQDIPATRHTAWSALNAVTEWCDHHKSARGGTEGERAANRLESSWFGSSARLKDRAFRLALDMATPSD